MMALSRPPGGRGADSPCYSASPGLDAADWRFARSAAAARFFV